MTCRPKRRLTPRTDVAAEATTHTATEWVVEILRAESAAQDDTTLGECAGWKIATRAAGKPAAAADTG
jgi:hypothetical protein